MAPWIIPAYIISGVVMATGAYLTILYRPYCTLKSPEREIAMELHRKKLMNEPMHVEENEKEIIIMRANRIFGYWVRIIFIAIVVHLGMLFILFMQKNWYLEMPLYILSGFLLIISHINWFTNAIVVHPFCLFNNNGEQVEILQIYHKQRQGEFLNADEQKVIKNTEIEIRWHGWQRIVFLFALGLHFFVSMIHGALTLLSVY